MQTLATVIAAMENRWPVSKAEDWDRPGLILGEELQQVSRVLLSVDLTSEVIEEAVEGRFDLVVSHHPLALRQTVPVAYEPLKQSLLNKASRAGLALYAAHTNVDITATGVSASLASVAGLTNMRPLVPVTEKEGHGRIGELAPPVTLLEFARMLASRLPSTASGVRVAGDPNQLISEVALCAGAGDSFIGEALASGADLYLTSDLRHHPVQEALQSAAEARRPFALIDIAHWAAEWLWLETAANELAHDLPQVTFVVSDLRTDPWDFVVTQ